MSCKFQQYHLEETYYPRLYCSLDGTRCLYSKRCELEHKFLPLGSEEECYKYNMHKEKNIPKGSYYVQMVRPHRNSVYLYVMYNNQIERMKFPNKEFNQNYIYIKEENGERILSQTPFEDSV